MTGKYIVLDNAQVLDQAVMLTIGAASTCWSDLPNAGTFDSDRARKAGEELIEWILENYEIMRKI